MFSPAIGTVGEARSNLIALRLEMNFTSTAHAPREAYVVTKFTFLAALAFVATFALHRITQGSKSSAAAPVSIDFSRCARLLPASLIPRARYNDHICIRAC